MASLKSLLEPSHYGFSTGLGINSPHSRRNSKLERLSSRVSYGGRSITDADPLIAVPRLRKLPQDAVPRAQVATTAEPKISNGTATDLKAGRASESVFNGQTLLSFGFPKGSLQQSTADLFHRAGYTVKFSERGYFPGIDDKDIQLVLFRSQEISRYVEDGVLDAGICGHDWVIENASDVHEVCELQYSKATSNPARWVLAVKEDSDVHSVEDLAGGIVASELVKTTRKYFEELNVPVKKVEYSWGATEVKASLPGVQAIVDITETGSSLRANKLRVVATILSSTTRLIANHTAWADPVKRRKIEDVATLLQGAIEGRGKVGLKMNVEKENLDTVLAVLPAEQSPTISTLLDSHFCAVEVVCDMALARELVPRVKRLGATGIFTYPLDVLIP